MNTFLTSVVTNQVTTSTLQYNTAGLRTSEQVTLNGVSGTFTTGYDYDAAGRLTRITYPSGRVVERSYQSSGGIDAGRLNTLKDNTSNTTLILNILRISGANPPF